MKKNIFVPLILSSFLLGGCVANQYTYDDAYRYSELNESYVIEGDYNEITINWLKGNVFVENNIDDPYSIVITPSETEKVAYYYANTLNNEVVIQYVKNHTPNEELENLSKDITISIGSKVSLHKLNLNLVNTTAKLYHTIGVDKLDISIVDGEVFGTSMYFNTMNFNSVHSVFEVDKLIKYCVENVNYNAYINLNLVDSMFKCAIDSDDGFMISKRSLLDSNIEIGEGLVEKDNNTFVFNVSAVTSSVNLNKAN